MLLCMVNFEIARAQTEALKGEIARLPADAADPVRAALLHIHRALDALVPVDLRVTDQVRLSTSSGVGINRDTPDDVRWRVTLGGDYVGDLEVGADGSLRAKPSDRDDWQTGDDWTELAKRVAY